MNLALDNHSIAAGKVESALQWVGRHEPIAVPTVLARWTVVEDSKNTATAATDGRTLFYNADWIAGLPLAGVRVVMLHEVGHVLSQHNHRRGRRDPKGFNIAGDLALNCMLLKGYTAAYDGNFSKFQADNEAHLKGCFVGLEPFDKLPHNLSAEEYYELLKIEAEKKRAENPPPSACPGPDSDEEEDGQGNGAPSPALDDDEEESDSAGTGNLDIKPKPSAAPTYQDQPARHRGLFDDLPDSNFGEVEDAPVESTLREDEAQVILAALTDPSGGYSSLGLGNLITSYKGELAGDPAKLAGLNWRRELERFLRNTHSTSAKYDRPSRRHGWRTDVLLPARRGKNKTRGVVLVDTSGSMRDQDCNDALHHLGKILSLFPQSTVSLIQCDTLVRASRDFRSSDFPLTEWKGWCGRGGTDMNPGFRWVKQRAVNYDWAIVVTDFEWPFGKAVDPGIPVLWIGTGLSAKKYLSYGETKGRDDMRIKFGKVVNMHVLAD